MFQLFSDNLVLVLDFLILQDKHNRRTLWVNIKCVYFCETGQKSPQRLVFLPVSKAPTSKLYILRECTDIVYMYMYHLI